MNSIVIVPLAPRVARDASLAGLDRRGLGRAIGEAEHHDAAHSVEHMPRMRRRPSCRAAM